MADDVQVAEKAAEQAAEKAAEQGQPEQQVQAQAEKAAERAAPKLSDAEIEAIARRQAEIQIELLEQRGAFHTPEPEPVQPTEPVTPEPPPQVEEPPVPDTFAKRFSGGKW